jgi:hypothetical protein
MEMKIIASVILLCGITSWAQVDVISLREEITARMDDGVKSFVESQRNNNQFIKKTVKTDLKGRSGNKGLPLTYNINISDIQKKKVIIDESTTKSMDYEGIHQYVEYNKAKNIEEYRINGKKVMKADFIKKNGEHRKNYLNRVKPSSKPRVANLNAKEIEEHLKNNKNARIFEYNEDNAQALATTTGSNYILDYQIRNRSGITNYALDKGYKGQNVGILAIELAKPSGNYNFYEWLDYKGGFINNKDSSHTRKTLRLLHATAPKATLYASYGWPNSITEVKNKGIHIISKSVTVGSSSNYTVEDKTADNVVYDYRVAVFAGVGNSGFNRPVPSPAMAFNTIGVGAVNPANDSVQTYTNTNNTTVNNKKRCYVNDKPEIVNYAEVRYSDRDTYSGTSAASPYTAAFAADMISQFPGLKWEPATLKAILLTWSVRAPKNPNFDTDNHSFKAQIPVYQKEPMNFIYGGWDAPNGYFFDKNKEINITLKNNIEAGKRYRIAISWLTSGDYLMNNTTGSCKIAQDIDLIVKKNGKIIASSKSANNPFELVDFVAPENGEYSIIIQRYSNHDPNENIVLGFSFLQVN